MHDRRAHPGTAFFMIHAVKKAVFNFKKNCRGETAVKVFRSFLDFFLRV
jgi:hypothetical protein